MLLLQIYNELDAVVSQHWLLPQRLVINPTDMWPPSVCLYRNNKCLASVRRVTDLWQRRCWAASSWSVGWCHWTNPLSPSASSGRTTSDESPSAAPDVFGTCPEQTQHRSHDQVPVFFSTGFLNTGLFCKCDGSRDQNSIQTKRFSC